MRRAASCRHAVETAVGRESDGGFAPADPAASAATASTTLKMSLVFMA
jgi:hypothetical protein